MSCALRRLRRAHRMVRLHHIPKFSACQVAWDQVKTTVKMSLVTDRLKKIREKNGLSQRELARLCDLGVLQVHRIENGMTDPSTGQLKIIAEKLNISVDYLLGLVDEPQAQYGKEHLSNEEHAILETFRREGWPGVLHLGADRFASRA